MRHLHCKISGAVEKALQDQHLRTGQSIGHIVRTALSDYLQVRHSTLFQISNITALVEGIYEGEITIDQLREHGDFGLGTFEGLDGEMIVVDGHFYQVRSDGRATEVEGSVKTPFAVVTHFIPEKTVENVSCTTFAELEKTVDSLRSSENIFYAVRIDGTFDFVRTRAMCKTPEGVPLVVAAAHQPEFEFHNVRGTLAGFWSPRYVSSLNVPGFHIHFINQERTGGGHLLDCRASNLRLQISRENDLRLALPENDEFLRADLTRDPSQDLKKAEH
ncbi:MAG: acetolactate decarboxylase [Verrucomicrobiae bacterium]|nr:acetolactate decarboxylase [Verrucomicrobiae bacterium]